MSMTQQITIESWMWHTSHLASGHDYIHDCDICNLRAGESSAIQHDPATRACNEWYAAQQAKRKVKTKAASA